MFGPAKPHVESQRPNKTKSTSLWSLMSSLRDASEKNAAVPPRPAARPGRTGTMRQCGSPRRHRAAGAPRPAALAVGCAGSKASGDRLGLPRESLVTARVYSPFFPLYETHAVVSNANRLRTLEVLSLTGLNLLVSACVSF